MNPPEPPDPIPSTTPIESAPPQLVPPSAGGEGLPMPPAPGPDEEAPPPKRSKALLFILIGIFVVAAIGVGAFFATKKGTSISLPATLAGQPQIHNPQFDVLTSGIQSQMQKSTGAKSYAAFYGNGSQPSVMVIGIAAGAGTDFPPMDQLASSFIHGLSGATGSVDTSATKRTTIGSTTYECAPFTVTASSGSNAVNGQLCLWNDGKTVGIVATFDSSTDGMSIVAEAHDASVH